MRTSSARRALAAGAAALISTPVLLLATVGPAEAFSGSATLGCRLYFDTGAGSSASVYNDTFTLTASPASPEVGDTVTVTATGATGPVNGPVALTPDSLEVNVFVTRNGSNQITLNDSTYPDGNVAPQTALGSWSAKGTFNATAAGDVDLVVKQIQFDYKAGQIDTWCSASGDRDHWHSPVATTISQTVTVSGGSTPTPTPTDTASPTPTPTPTDTSSPTPTPTDTATPTPTPTDTSSPTPTPTDTATTSPSPTPTQSGGSTDVATGSATANLTCELPPAFSSSSPWKAELNVNAKGNDLSLAWDAGPKTGPVPILAGTQKASATIKAAGATVKLTAPALNVDQSPYTQGPGQTVTGTISSVPASISVDQIFFDDTSASDVDVTCMPDKALVIELTSVSVPNEPPPADGALTVTGTPTAGGSVTLSGSGFGPDTGVTAIMYSSPVVLGQDTADASGDASMTVTIPSNAASGEHTMVLLGESPTGEQYVLSTTVNVTGGTGGTGGTPTDGTTDELPHTGARETAMTAIVALILLQVGLIVAVRSYRAMPSRASGSHRSA